MKTFKKENSSSRNFVAPNNTATWEKKEEKLSFSLHINHFQLTTNETLKRCFAYR